MAQYKVLDPEDLCECPYDDGHMIRAKRFPYHLMKCRKNYTGNEWSTCPFNARHIVPRPELRYHIGTCCDKALLEQDIVNGNHRGDGCYFGGDTSVPEYKHRAPEPPCQENWDAELTAERVQIVDPGIFTGKSQAISLEQETEIRREQIIQRLRQRGIPVQTTSCDPPRRDAPLKLPQKPSATLLKVTQYTEKMKLAQKQATMVSTKTQITMGGVARGSNAGTADGLRLKELQEDAALLQTLARGRGIGRGVPNLEPRLGSMQHSHSLADVQFYTRFDELDLASTLCSEPSTKVSIDPES